jgi:hypothetical protein
MTKSIENGKVVYNFLDVDRWNIEINTSNQILYFETIYTTQKFKSDRTILINNTIKMGITQETAKDLIKVLQEFAETGELI